MFHLSEYVWDVLVTFYVDGWFYLITRTKPFQGRMCFCLLPYPHIISTKLSFVSSAYIISNSFAGSKSICRLLSKSYFSFFLLIWLFKRLVHFTCPEFEQSVLWGKIATKHSTNLFPLLLLWYKAKTLSDQCLTLVFYLASLTSPWGCSLWSIFGKDLVKGL